MQKHTDKSYEAIVATIREDGDDYAAILIQRLRDVHKKIEALEAVLKQQEESPIDKPRLEWMER